MGDAPQDFLRSGGDTYESKNEDYGDSWRKVGQILYLLADGNEVVLETPQDHVSYGLFTRRLDKLARAYHGEFLSDEPNHEPILDAHEDEMVYAAMAASNLSSPPEWSQTTKSTNSQDGQNRQSKKMKLFSKNSPPFLRAKESIKRVAESFQSRS